MGRDDKTKGQSVGPRVHVVLGKLETYLDSWLGDQYLTLVGEWGLCEE
jgi:hypothetical protein